MATNLNRPADFTRNQSKDKTTTFLIPPSEFEKPAAKDLGDAERERHHILSFQTESEQIKHLQNQLQSHVAASSWSRPQTDYADELIKRQAGDIADLRSQLTKCLQAHEQDVAEWEKKFAFLEEEHQEEVRKLEKHLARTEEEYEEKLSRLNAELEQTLTNAESQTSALREKLKSTQLLLDSRVQELEDERASMQKESETIRLHLEAELRNKTRLIESQGQEITRLKSYICEAEEAHKPTLVWKMEKETMDNKLKLSQAENMKLSSELELLDLRFKSLNEIISVQELEFGQPKTSMAGKSKQTSLLITRWREKVYSLLVQQKSAEILHKKDLHNLNQKIKDLQNDLAARELQLQVLQHSLTDKSAQLQIEVNKTEALEYKLEQAQQAAIRLDDQTEKDYISVKSLSEFVENWSKCYSDGLVRALEEKSNILKTLGQRISFAASRMEVLQTQLIRKTAFSMGLSKEALQTPSLEDNQLPSRDSKELVQQELEKVMNERDSLAAQLRGDTEKWTKILSEARSQYTAEVAALRRNVEQLEHQVQLKSKKCAEMEEMIQSLKEDTASKDDLIKQLQSDLARHALGVETVLTDQRLKDKAIWNEKLADMERKLNNSKREHAKAVVSLRQMEHSHKRRLQQEQDLLQTTEEHLSRQIKQLQNRLTSVEKERNLMMATLKQEGLLNRLKSERGEPIILSDHHDSTSSVLQHSTSSVLQHSTNNSKVNIEDTGTKSDGNVDQLNRGFQQGDNIAESKDRTTSADTRFHREPVHLVLADLKSLTAAIFEDDDDDDVDHERRKKDCSDDNES